MGTLVDPLSTKIISDCQIRKYTFIIFCLLKQNFIINFVLIFNLIFINYIINALTLIIFKFIFFGLRSVLLSRIVK